MPFYNIYRLNIQHSHYKSEEDKNSPAFCFDGLNRDASQRDLFQAFKGEIWKKHIEELTIEDDIYSCQSYYGDNIMLLQLINNKNKQVVQNMIDIDVPHNPFSNIIFFFDEEYPYLAIEKKTSAFRTTEKVNDLIMKGLNMYLYKKFISVRLESELQIRQELFWENVEYILKSYDDTLKSINIKTNYSHNEFSPEEKAMYLDQLQEKLKCVFSKEYVFDEIEDISCLGEVLKKIVEFSDEKKLCITTIFKKYGSLKYGENLTVMYEINNSLIENIINNEENSKHDKYKELESRLLEIKSSVVNLNSEYE
jgi:hypothetical protein